MNYLLEEYRKEIFNINKTAPYKREIFNTLKKEISNFNLCLVGIRQVGKTTLMLQLANYYFKKFIKDKPDNAELIRNISKDEETIFYLNIKSINNVNEEDKRKKLLKELSNKKYKLIVLDEIQEIDEWTNFLQVAIDLNRNAKFIVSGSNASALSNERMVGRIKVFYIYPLLFNEYKEIWEDNKIDNYLMFGSYPKNKNHISAKVQYIELVKENIIDKIVNNDYKKSIDGNKFFSLLSDINNYIGNEINSSKLEKNNKTRQTVQNYLTIMRNARLIHLVPKYNDKNSSRKNKVYYEDKSMIFYFNDFDNLNNNLKGSLIENAIFNLLIYKYENIKPGDSIFYFRDNNEHEIDFVIPSIKTLIECKYIKNIDVEVEAKKMNEISKNNKFDGYKKIIITRDYNIEVDGVNFVSFDRAIEGNYEW